MSHLDASRAGSAWRNFTKAGFCAAWQRGWLEQQPHRDQLKSNLILWLCEVLLALHEKRPIFVPICFLDFLGWGDMASSLSRRKVSVARKTRCNSSCGGKKKDMVDDCIPILEHVQFPELKTLQRKIRFS